MKQMINNNRWAILAVALLFAWACTSKTGPQWIEPRSVSLLPAEKTVQVGEQFQLTASVLPEDATDKSVRWNSTNPEKVTVNDKGMVSALAQGSAYVVARTVNEIKASCLVWVKSPETASYKVSLSLEDETPAPGEVYGWPGKNTRLIAASDDGLPHSYYWSSSQDGITVEEGLVAFGLGTSGTQGYARYVESVIRAVTPDGVGASVKAISSLAENFHFGAASVKMGESVPMLAGKSVELEVFWFDGTSLQPIPSTQLKFISKDSSLISVSGTTVTSADDAVGRTFLALQIAGSEMTLCTVSVEKDGSKPSVLDSYIEEKPGWR